MGLDGGTIPSRADILRRSSWRLANTSTSRSTRGGNVDNVPSAEPNQGTKQEQARQKWNSCALSGDKLAAPIVVCELGKLYNRSSVIEFLLGEGIFAQNREELKKNGFGHITSIKNVFEVQLTKNEAADSKKATTNFETTSHEPGLFMCPVTQLETNGMHQFCVLKTCGHVFSEKALNLFQELTGCWTCNTPYTKDDIIPVYGNEKAVAELEEKVRQRQEKEKEKKDKKKKKKEGKEKEKEKDKKEKSKEKGKEDGKEKEKEKEKGKKRLAIEGPVNTTTTTTTTTTTRVSAPSPHEDLMPPPPKKIKV